MNQWLTLVVGLVAGGAAAWIWTASRFRASQIEAEARIRAAQSTITGLREQMERSDQQVSALRDKLDGEGERRVAAETRLQEAQFSLQQQKQLLEKAEAKLSDTFRALSAEALRSNNQAFIDLAKSTFETIQAQAKGELEKRQTTIDALLHPLKESLEHYERQVVEMEIAREGAYSALQEQLRSLSVTHQQLQKDTGSLASALRGNPQIRGRWGEMTLRRVAELAGMSEYCDFSEQVMLTGEAGRMRPDMVVNLPGGRRIAVDAKVPLQAFLDAAAATNDKDRSELLARHCQLLRAHMNQLAAKNYWEQFDPAPEIVVLFLPAESFFSTAVEQDRTLIEDGMQKRVVLATPTTLIALLRAVAYGWRQERIAQSAQAISDLGRELHGRLNSFIEHFQGIGSALVRAVENYNKAAGSLESRVLISARKFKELGAAAGEGLGEISLVDAAPRPLFVSASPVPEAPSTKVEDVSEADFQTGP
jgi:DNA recombination protein RmuC